MGRRIYTDIIIRGTVYPTAQAAAKAHGVQPQTVIHALKRDTLDHVGRGRRGPDLMPVRIRGVVYPSAKAAAVALGVKVGAVYQALSRNRLDLVGLPREYNPRRSHPFSIAGMSWPSKAAASRALGFGPCYIAHALKIGSRVRQEKILAAAMRLAQERAAT